jgi:hypothetical protein
MGEARRFAVPGLAVPGFEVEHSDREPRIGNREQSALWPLASALLLGVMTALHLWSLAAGVHDLAPDEAHYWEWSRRLDWSYYSKGPLVAYLIALSTGLGESTAFFVRLPAVILSLGTSLLLYRLASGTPRTEGRGPRTESDVPHLSSQSSVFSASEARVGFLALLLVSAFPLLNAGGMLMTTDVPLLFCWTLLLFSLQRALHGQQPVWWVLCGISLGVGFLAKYSMLLALPCIALAAWRTPALARALRTWRPYVALLIAAVLITPVLVWNFQHQWLSVRHVGTLAGMAAPTFFSPASIWKFIGGQLGIVTPGLLILLCVSLRAAWRDRDGNSWLLWCMSAPLLLFFVTLSMVTDVEANWAAPAYLSALVLAARSFHRAGTEAWRFFGAFVALLLVPGWSINVVAHFPALLPGVGIQLPVRLDPTARLVGWSDLGIAVGRARAHEPEDTFLMSESYQVASALAFYTPGQPRVFNINIGRRMNQYDVWGGLGDLVGRNGLYVTAGRWDGSHPVRAACARLEPVDVIDIVRWGSTVRTFSVLRCVDYRGMPSAATRMY